MRDHGERVNVPHTDCLLKRAPGTKDVMPSTQYDSSGQNRL